MNLIRINNNLNELGIHLFLFDLRSSSENKFNNNLKKTNNCNQIV